MGIDRPLIVCRKSEHAMPRRAAQDLKTASLSTNTGFFAMVEAPIFISVKQTKT